MSLVAFASLGVQAEGLIGSRGILPAAEALSFLERWHGAARFVRAPTLFWLGASDRALEAVCTAGVALSVLLVAGIAPHVVLALLWAAYLSLCTVAAPFLGYQWDALLVETLFAALFLAPPVWREQLASDSPPPRSALLLARCLLLKLMFLSGFVKLASEDPTWRALTALDYHYWTQPIPNRISVYAAALPHAVHATSVVITLAIELVVPFLLFGPTTLRRTAALALVGFQILLAVTGNFAFFNWLTIVCCLPALDDALLARLLPLRLRERPPPPRPPPRARLPRRALFACAIVLVFGANALVLAQRLSPATLPDPARDALAVLAPWRTVNGYGLFAVMTTERPEIVVEGTPDGTTWRAYEFRWKPGPLDRAPAPVAPHQPRLDWEMWFAALRGCRRSPWFARFEERLLEGSEPVLRLLAANPFPDAPPREIRSTVYRYGFAPAELRRRTGRWWVRDEPGATFCPPLRAPR